MIANKNEPAWNTNPIDLITELDSRNDSFSANV
ncbi:Uncharacterised protein [Streptococcus pneumoniae]|nr:Uncharacterised protein [Streptococcus pneumoniae]CRH96996.1 Uncharacterised protein [Streptococcus pneumoniae]